MNRGEATVSLIKLVATSAGTAGFISSILDAFTTYVQLPVWGVPVTVIGAAGAGAILSLFFGDPLETRRDLFGQTIAATFFGAACAVLVSDGLNWDWAAKNMAMFALMSAAMIRWFLPSVIERGKQLIKDFKFSFTKKTEGGDR